jgi:NAD(P)-dependent dehydrogenase (short-subunit alcohol dehydrogenase family)
MTQLAIAAFKRQAHGHGVVVLISSIAAQMALLPVPLYAASKAAVSSFTRSMAPLEAALNIRVVAVAPGIVKTPIWDAYKLGWVDDQQDEWVTKEQVTNVMLDLIQKSEYVGGTIVEVGVDKNRLIERLNDPGPSGRGHAVSKVVSGVEDVFELIDKNFGK